MKSTIICVGNRLVSTDASGLAVFDRLQGLKLPRGLDLVEGGLAGLNLLPHLEKGGRVVFVDSVSGFGEEGAIVVFDKMDDIKGLCSDHYGHASGLPYLLSVLPKVCDGILPEEILLIGMEGSLAEKMIDRAAELAVSLAVEGVGGDA